MSALEARPEVSAVPGPTSPTPRTAVNLVRDAQFALAKFRATTLPATLVERPELCARLSGGADQRLTVVIGSAGAGKSVLLSSWVQQRPDGLTSWLACDEADADPLRFWGGFVRSIRAVAPTFGTSALDLLVTEGVPFADVVAAVANDARRLPPGFAVVVDDFHDAEPSVAKDLVDLIALWPSDAVQLVLASRSDPQVRLQRLRMAGDLCELREEHLNFSFQDSGTLLSRFGVSLPMADLALLHQRSEGWPAALQMTALALRTCRTPREVRHALDVHSLEISEYFICEVLEEQAPELAEFMLETSVLSELTAESCAAITNRRDAGALLRSIDHAHLFLVPLDDERTRFRFHRLVRDVLRAEMRRRDRVGEQQLQLRAAAWFESVGDARRAARHYVVAREAEHALALLHEQVIPDFLRDPTLPDVLESDLIDDALLSEAPDRGLALALDLLLSGDAAGGGAILSRAALARPQSELDLIAASRLGLASAMHALLTGRPAEALSHAKGVQRQLGDCESDDSWKAALSLILLRIHSNLEQSGAVAHEVLAAETSPRLAEPVRAVMVPGLHALSMVQQGRLTEAGTMANDIDLEARRLGVTEHLIAADYLRAQAGLALEQRDLAQAEQWTQRALAVSGRSPLLAYEAGLDQADILLAGGQVKEALAAIGTARALLSDAEPTTLARAVELEAYARLTLGDVPGSAELAGRLGDPARTLLLARLDLATGRPDLAHERLVDLVPGELTPRRALVRELLLAAAAIERGDPSSQSAVTAAVLTARRGGFCHTVLTSAPQVADFLVSHASPTPSDAFYEGLVKAALELRASTSASRPPAPVVDQLTAAERRVLDLLPTHTYRQMAEALFISPHTVKSHLRSVYRKIGAESRAQALERAMDLRLL